MKKLRILVALIMEQNDYQVEQASVARKTAERLGIDVDVVYADNKATTQTHQILGSLRAGPDERPDAIVVEPVGTGMPLVARTAVDNGIGWVVVNREGDYLAPLRSASVPVGTIDCDNVEVGRIQGRQFAALLPSGGSVLYIEGAATDASKQRRTGVEQTLPANIELKAMRGHWTEEEAFQATRTRLWRPAERPDIGVIGCQNDAMAMGARRAIEGLTNPQARDRWLKLPFTGCDGVPDTGQRWVRDGQLAATVIIPALTGVAIEMLVRAIESGTQLPERTVLKPVSYPPVEQLVRRSA